MDERLWSVVADRYRLGRRIAQGQAAGGGATYIAYDLHIDQKVAVTLYSAGDLQGRSVNQTERADERFIIVNRRLARIDHAGIPQIRDVGRLGDEVYVVAALVEGVSLAHVLSEPRHLGPGSAAAIGAHVCAALQAAHSKGVTHGDLKPASILLSPDCTVKILGFGSPATPSRPTASRPTADQHDAYKAPEQVRGACGFPGSDLYALGTILFHMVTGQPPFAAGTGDTAPQDCRTLTTESARAIMPETPVALDRLISALMAEVPGDRPSDATTVYNQLLEFIEAGESTPIAGSCDPSLAFKTPGLTLLRSADATVPGINYFQSDPDDHDIRSHMEGLFGLREDHPRKGQYQLVLDALREFLAKWSFLANHPEGLHYRFEEAEILLTLGEPQEALSRLTALVDLFTKAEAGSPTKACECRMLIGDCLAAAGRTEDALTTWRSALAEWVKFDGGRHPKIADLRHRIRAAELAHGGDNNGS